MGITKPDRARLLDLTRLVRRAGRMATGVDRVTEAYLDRLIAEPVPLFGLVRSALGYILLDRDGCEAFRARRASGLWGEADRLSRLSPDLGPMRARVESDLRRLSLDRCLPIRLPRMLARRLPGATTYIDTAHGGLTPRLLSALRHRPGTRIAVFLHDTIPLDHPHLQRPGAAARFERYLRRVARYAHVIVVNSAQTAADLRRHCPALKARVVEAPLGVTVPRPGEAPRGPWTGAPYFVTLGTIEPRKNHALLLDLWPEIPDAHLLICGSRGWNNRAVFERLDARPERIHECAGLGDAAVAALLCEARGLLCPSVAEGYGLPAIEAAGLGVPVVCNTLPVYRETLGDIPVYAAVSDRYRWIRTITSLAQGSGAATDHGFRPPDWDAHFAHALAAI